MDSFCGKYLKLIVLSIGMVPREESPIEFKVPMCSAYRDSKALRSSKVSESNVTNLQKVGPFPCLKSIQRRIELGKTAYHRRSFTNRGYIPVAAYVDFGERLDVSHVGRHGRELDADSIHNLGQFVFEHAFV